MCTKRVEKRAPCIRKFEKKKKIGGQNSEALFYASEFFRLLFQFDGRFERDLHHLREGRLALLGGQGLAREHVIGDRADAQGFQRAAFIYRPAASISQAMTPILIQAGTVCRTSGMPSSSL